MLTCTSPTSAIFFASKPGKIGKSFARLYFFEVLTSGHHGPSAAGTNCPGWESMPDDWMAGNLRWHSGCRGALTLWSVHFHMVWYEIRLRLVGLKNGFLHIERVAPRGGIPGGRPDHSLARVSSRARRRARWCVFGEAEAASRSPRDRRVARVRKRKGGWCAAPLPEHEAILTRTHRPGRSRTLHPVANPAVDLDAHLRHVVGRAGPSVPVSLYQITRNYRW